MYEYIFPNMFAFALTNSIRCRLKIQFPFVVAADTHFNKVLNLILSPQLCFSTLCKAEQGSKRVRDFHKSWCYETRQTLPWGIVTLTFSLEVWSHALNSRIILGWVEWESPCLASCRPGSPQGDRGCSVTAFRISTLALTYAGKAGLSPTQL